ncbi:Mg-protoporphyrin IX methyl transferase [Aquisphaera giovannonii]|uniref:Mg-protoporphyrin IX methyl transferase n=1 Tax=Aquisphaera giovannonii TaxID=406548 RepID=A0A5B9WBL9_9BACT|nr:class I SAM-dependent methyltransferase [Aquisphaera giovannonii]QEH37972.1 Mg-protoporphyrin IX methyl transferase [Aquisphaera giovannonii]
MDRDRFEQAYRERPPWDIPGPQPALVELAEAEAGAVRSPVLDAGCGTGENALFLASRGHDVLGLDYVEAAIEKARAKAADRGGSARFEVGSALELDRLGATFETVIDCGLFHTFDDDQRRAYVESLRAAVRPGGLYVMLCFSDREPAGQGPRRITQEEIREAFRDGWVVESIRATRFRVTDHPEAWTFSPGGPHAWLATIARAAAPES